MKASKVLILAILLFLQAAATTVFAQHKPQVGDTITGVVFDDNGPMMLVNVTERDSTGRVVAHDLTVMDGSFSFKLVNPKDRLVVNFVGYDKVDIPIDSTYFEIKMMDQGDTIIILDCNPNAPIPIPLRDSSDVFPEIDMSEFEGLGFTTIDEVLNAKFGLDLPFTVSDHVQVKTKPDITNLRAAMSYGYGNYLTSNMSSQYAYRCVMLRFSAYEFGTFDDEIDLDIGWIDKRGILAGTKWSKKHITQFDMTGPAFIRPVF